MTFDLSSRNFSIPITDLSISHSAEKQILTALFDLTPFEESSLQRRIALYPGKNNEKKSQIILKIMDSLLEHTPIKSYMPIFHEFDKFMATIGKRDHFVHQFEVYLLGINILALLLKSKPFKSLFEHTEIHEFCSVWLIVSMSHDLGYPLQEAKELIKQIKTLYQSFYIKNIAKEYEKLEKKDLNFDYKNIKKINIFHPTKRGKTTLEYLEFVEIALSESLNNEVPNLKDLIEKYINSKIHGFSSAAILFNSLRIDIDKRPKNASEFKTYEKKLFHIKQIVAAIILHSLPSAQKHIFKKIQFKHNPYAYLLFIADNIQDWSRYVLQHPRRANYILDRFHNEQTKLRIDFILSDNEWPTEMKEKTSQALDEKKALLQMPTGPTPSTGCAIELNYKDNFNTINKEIKILL